MNASLLNLEKWPSIFSVPIAFLGVCALIVLAGGATLIGMFFPISTASAIALINAKWRYQWAGYVAAAAAWLMISATQVWIMHLVGCTSRMDADYYQEQEPFIY